MAAKLRIRLLIGFCLFCGMGNNVFFLRVLAISWLLLITALFFLPGSALPHEDFLGIPHFDKLVHFGFFAVLLYLWRLSFPISSTYTNLLLLLAFCYGLVVELIQYYFIAYRSFDLADLLADMIGAAAGILGWWWYKKNRPL